MNHSKLETKITENLQIMEEELKKVRHKFNEGDDQLIKKINANYNQIMIDFQETNE